MKKMAFDFSEPVEIGCGRAASKALDALMEQEMKPTVLIEGKGFLELLICEKSAHLWKMLEPSQN